ncbi:MAG: Na+/H+ antiporter NhaC family protein [Spirochaetota bacterium]
MDSFGLLSLLPFILALFLVLRYQDILIPLVGALVIGSILLARFNPLLGLFQTAGEMLFGTLRDPTTVLILLTAVEALILYTLLDRRGYVAHFVHWTCGRALSLKKLESFILGSAAAVFVDRVLAALLAGIFTRPLAERKNLSPHRHAFILNTTSSPLAGLLPLTTLTPVTLAAVGVSFRSLGIQFSPLQALLYSIPYQFYSIFSLFMVISLVVLQKEPVAMTQREGEEPFTFGMPPQKKNKKKSGAPPLARYAVPAALVVLFGAVAAGLALTNRGAAAGLGEPRTIQVAFANALFAAVVFVVLFALISRACSYRQLTEEHSQAFRAPLTVLFYLVLSLAMAGMAGKLQVHRVLVQLWPRQVYFVPAAVFIASCLVGFLSGSAPLTVSVMLPVALQAISARLSDPLLVNQYIFAGIAAVQSGAVFGDMNSPFSPTFIFSTAGAGSSLLGHFRTQIFYSLGCFLVSTLFGYTLLALEVSPYLSISAGFLVIGGAVVLISKLTGETRA